MSLRDPATPEKAIRQLNKLVERAQMILGIILAFGSAFLLIWMAHNG